MSAPLPEPTPATPWLVRIPDVFEGFTTEILEAIGTKPGTRLGSGYHLIHPSDPASLRASDASMVLRWNLPVEHSWPCNPQKMDGFIEKAAQTLLRKFGHRQPQALLIGLLDPSSSNGHYKIQVRLGCEKPTANSQNNGGRRLNSALLNPDASRLKARARSPILA